MLIWISRACIFIAGEVHPLNVVNPNIPCSPTRLAIYDFSFTCFPIAGNCPFLAEGTPTTSTWTATSRTSSTLRSSKADANRKWRPSWSGRSSIPSCCRRTFTEGPSSPTTRSTATLKTGDNHFNICEPFVKVGTLWNQKFLHRQNGESKEKHL